MLEEFIMVISVAQVDGMEVSLREMVKKKGRANLSHFFTVRCLDNFWSCRSVAVTHLKLAPVPLQSGLAE